MMNRYIDPYNKLQDELSRSIYGYRILFTETGDVRWIHEVLKLIPEGREFLGRINDNTREKVIFGAGAWGKEIADFFPGCWSCFLDNYSDETEYHGIPVIRFDEYIKKHKEADIVLTARLHYKSMVDQLVQNGVDENNIINMGKAIDDMSKRQYFDLEMLPHSDNEVFVDCGCLDGMTSKSFVKWCKGEYKEIFAFEPDDKQIEKCIYNLRDERVTFLDKGVWSSKTELKFIGALEGSSHINEMGSQTISVDKLDNVLGEKTVSFIKMDIEGAEREALIGAEKLIKLYKPKLAISIYHKPEDIYEIPNLLLNYNENYVFYMRHYSVSASETVLYAIDRNELNDL